MIDAETKLLAVIGNPVGHSLSPAMQNAALQKLGLNYAYLALEAKNIGTAIEAMRELGFRGYSVTVPHKETVIQFLDSIDALAKKIGAVNTVVNNDGFLEGYNTDALAAICSLKKMISLKGKKANIVGAGGVARAIAFALKQEGAFVTVFDLVPQKAESLAAEVGCSQLPLKDVSSAKADLLVNATPIGMFPKTHESPVGKSVLKNYSAVFDVVYNPAETLLLKQAKAAGCKTISGLEMFVSQGAEQFRLWTGREAPIKLMKKTVEHALKAKNWLVFSAGTPDEKHTTQIIRVSANSPKK